MLFAHVTALAVLSLFGSGAQHHSPIDNFGAHSPIHVRQHSAAGPLGLTPAQIKTAYNLPASGGAGKTIAIVDAYDSATIAGDLNAFSAKFGLPQCVVSNPCFEKQTVSPRTPANSGWALEEALDTEWAHAVAPQAKILLVEARSASGADLLSAVDYARSRPDVVAVSMSWGGGEFSGESSYDPHFTSTHGVVFFSSAGDSGAGVSWPAVSPNVIGVGGTTLAFTPSGAVSKETAWSGSGGGVSAFIPEPTFQSALVTQSNGRRSTPDVAYNADPASGYAVYDATRYSGQSGWFQVGGTSAGAPQWAAIHALGGAVSSPKLYADAAGSLYAAHFRDILAGTNGRCGARCTAAPGYDSVTGLGSPLTTNF